VEAHIEGAAGAFGPGPWPKREGQIYSYLFLKIMINQNVGIPFNLIVDLFLALHRYQRYGLKF
jgi:hypothetical protein